MAILRPFKALRPLPQKASQICELPYDVYSTDEAREIARGNPLSFLNISKPEIGLPAGTDPYSSEVYALGKKQFQQLIQEGNLIRDRRPGFYFYRQVMGTHSQVGLVALASCEEYDKGQIKRHEFTRPDKENDRVRHIETLEAQTGPAFLLYPANREMARLVETVTARPPEIDFTSQDSVRHSAWVVDQPEIIEKIEALFRSMPSLYIADGHHRTAAALRVAQKRNGIGESGFFLSVLFSSDQVKILPYNRAIKDLNGKTTSDFIKALGKVCEIRKNGLSLPVRKHQVCLYIDHAWHELNFLPAVVEGKKGIDQLDVSLLQDNVLSPLLGIDNPRTSHRISFVGGIRGVKELQRIVDNKEHVCAFSMYPTGVGDLMTIADSGGIMPPKSTWFEPKLRDGLFSHMFGS